MVFTCVYVKSRKKFDKFGKVNKLKNKYVIDVKKMLEKEEENDVMFLKILIFDKIRQAIEKKRDIYFIPNFDSDFNINKLLNIRQILEDENDFNILVFYDDFQKDCKFIDEAYDHLDYFDNSQIIRDY